MKLPENVIALILLDGANITEDERKSVLTLANNITFENTKSALKKDFFLEPENYNPVTILC